MRKRKVRLLEPRLVGPSAKRRLFLSSGEVCVPSAATILIYLRELLFFIILVYRIWIFAIDIKRM